MEKFLNLILITELHFRKKIIARAKQLGMDVVLQGFAGMVPSTFNSKIKDATVIDQSKWCGYQRPPIIYGAYCDSVAKYWYQSSENLYGKAAFYGGDAFHEGGIVPKDLNLSQYATNLQNWMLQTNKDAIWLLQAWQNNPKNGFLDGLKKENTMILDYSNDVYGFWKQRNGFDGFPWIFGVINNFGGRMGAYGRLQKVADEAYQLQSHPSKKNLKGVGIAPEAIVYNQVSYDIIWDLVWDTTQIQTADWICRFADKRYGVSSPRMHQAWQILNETAFSCSTRQEGGTESVINARPSLEINNVSCCSTSEIYYDPAELVKAWELMIESADELKNVNTFKFDLVDLTRQVLADYARKLYSEMISAYKSSNKELFAVKSKLFLELIRFY